VEANQSIRNPNRKIENGLYLGTAFFNDVRQDDIMGCSIQTTAATTTTTEKLQQ